MKLLNKQTNKRNKTILALFHALLAVQQHQIILKIVMFPCMSAILRDCTSVCVSQSHKLLTRSDRRGRTKANERVS